MNDDTSDYSDTANRKQSCGHRFTTLTYFKTRKNLEDFRAHIII